MSKKIWLIIATVLVASGLIIFTVVMSIYQWDFKKLSTRKYETNEYEITEEIKDITFIADTADIVFAVSKDGKNKVVCYEETKAKHSVTAQEGKLTVQVEDKKQWYDNISINFGSPKITVYLQQGEYGQLSVKSSTGDIELPNAFAFTSLDISVSTGDVKSQASISGSAKIKTSTGGIQLENISVGTLDLSVSTGRVTVANLDCTGDIKISVSTGKTVMNTVACKNLISDGDTGDISLTGVVASGKFLIERSTGDVKFDGSDAAEISVTTDTGDVTGTLLTEKIFIVDTDTGEKEIPNTLTGGKCEIATDTGDIKIAIR